MLSVFRLIPPPTRCALNRSVKRTYPWCLIFIRDIFLSLAFRTSFLFQLLFQVAIIAGTPNLTLYLQHHFYGDVF